MALIIYSDGRCQALVNLHKDFFVLGRCHFIGNEKNEQGNEQLLFRCKLNLSYPHTSYATLPFTQVKI